MIVQTEECRLCGSGEENKLIVDTKQGGYICLECICEQKFKKEELKELRVKHFSAIA